MQFNKKKLPLQPVTETEFERFTEALNTYFEKTDAGGNEEDLKNNLSQFFNHIFQGKNEVSSQGIKGGSGIDMVIYLGKTRKSKAGVHIEVKAPTNTSEMISPENLNRKAFHESVLYFLYDKIENKNNESKHIIISNLEEFFIFDAQEFTRLFIRDNKMYSNEFEAWKNGQRNDTTTKHIYEFIAEKMTQSDKQISGYHIKLNDYRKHLNTLDDKPNDFEARNRLAQLCHIFSPQFLLKQIDTNDSNTLNKDFYHELLHIIGLKEVKVKGKKLIQRKPEAEREHASMLENTISELDEILSKFDQRHQYGSTREEQQFGIALELCLTWVNRILFLKLLESQLYQYNNQNDDYKFLSHSKIQSYDQLKTLFFEVLAKLPKDRDSRIKEEYANIPYLNSSLFESTDLEYSTVRISGLKDHYQLSVHPKTKLQDRFADNKCPTLEYFLRFLDAYDFGAVGKQELIRDERKPLINAAVLGLIFEKINGYKEGSFYTPGFVTMYMCRETIRRAALQKINNQLAWNCKDLREVRDKIDSREDRKAVNETINTLTICDPAVGSGHFLVSALNEIIAIKAELRVILDSKGNRVYCRINIENDELQIKNENDLPFTYQLNSKSNIIQDKQIIQEAIFREKQTIIENCLFGVDINSNSVKICRLRLWIELLKNAFYTAESNYRNLETLPNIDINIKQGNSLISRFPLDENLNEVFKKQKYNIETYKNTVAAYRSTRDRDTKQQLQKFLDDIKDQFQTTLASRDPLRKRMSKLRGEILLLENPDLFTNGKTKPKPNGIDKKKKELAELEQQKQDIESNKIYQNAFEWRFEFPEVLDANGEYVGFDLIIGNPPYGRYIGMSDAVKEHLRKNKLYGKTGDIAESFIRKVLMGLTTKNQLFSFIIPKGLSYVKAWRDIRLMLLQENFICQAIDTSRSFDEAAYEMMIIVVSSENPKKIKTGFLSNEIEKFETIDKTLYNQDIFFFGFPKGALKIEKKIQQNCETVDKYYNYWYGKGGMTPKVNKKKIGLKVLTGKEIQKFYVKQIPNKWYIDKSLLNELDLNRANLKKVVVQDIVAHITKPKPHIKLTATLDTKGQFCLNTLMCFSEKSKLDNEFLVGLINSKFMSFYYYYFIFNQAIRTMHFMPGYADRMPIPKKKFSHLPISKKVTQILTLKREDPQADTSTLEAEIDRIVYDLYGLTKKEIKIIESAVG